MRNFIAITLERMLYKLGYPFAHIYFRKFRRMQPAVSCLIEHKGKFLLIRNTYGSRLWIFPGGRVKRKETPEEAIVREVHEEVGIAIEPKALIYLGEHFGMNRGKKQSRVHCYYASVEKPDFVIDPVEIFEAAWFSPREVPALQSIAVGRAFALLKNYREKTSPV